MFTCILTHAHYFSPIKKSKLFEITLAIYNKKVGLALDILWDSYSIQVIYRNLKLEKL